MLEKSDGIVFEMQRLQDTVKAKEREMERLHRDITAYKSSEAAKERLLQQKAKECETSKERCLRAETDAASNSKQLIALKAEQRKLVSQVADLQRVRDKLTEKVAALSNKGPGFSEAVASLQAELKLAKADSAKMAEDNKALTSQVRAKDKELGAAQSKLEWAKGVEMTNKGLTNDLAAAAKGLAEAQAEIKTLLQVQRQKEADIASLTRALDKARAEKQAGEDALQRKEAELKAERATSAQLTSELGLTRDELARVSAVAGRVAASENKAGIKAEGTVAVGQHVEEMKYLGGEITRLKDKVTLLERDLGVAARIQERYRAALAAANLPTDLEGAENPARRRSSIGIPSMAPTPGRSGGSRAASVELEPSAAKVQEQAISEVAALPADVASSMSTLSLGGAATKRGKGQRDQGKPTPAAASPAAALPAVAAGAPAAEAAAVEEVGKPSQQQQQEEEEVVQAAEAAAGEEEPHDGEEGEEEEGEGAQLEAGPQPDQKSGRRKRGNKKKKGGAAAAGAAASAAAEGTAVAAGVDRVAAEKAAAEMAAAAATRRSSRRKKDQAGAVEAA